MEVMLTTKSWQQIGTISYCKLTPPRACMEQINGGIGPLFRSPSLSLLLWYWCRKSKKPKDMAMLSNNTLVGLGSVSIFCWSLSPI